MLHNRAEISITAVSYTHLDVYKRQTVRGPNKIRTNKLQQRGKQMETMTTMKILKKKKEEGQGNVP